MERSWLTYVNGAGANLKANRQPTAREIAVSTPAKEQDNGEDR
jgi:hypothetical protein